MGGIKAWACVVVIGAMVLGSGWLGERRSKRRVMRRLGRGSVRRGAGWRIMGGKRVRGWFWSEIGVDCLPLRHQGTKVG